METLLPLVEHELGAVFEHLPGKEVLRPRATAGGRAVLLINWLDTLYYAVVPRPLAALSFGLPGAVVKRLASLVGREVLAAFERLRAGGARLVFFDHDLTTFSKVPFTIEVDKIVRGWLRENSDALVYAERSAAEEVLGKGRDNSRVFVSQLGSYRAAHGSLPTRECARKALGIRVDAVVLFAFGTIRKSRNLAGVISAVEASDNGYLLASGRGNKNYESARVRVFPGFGNNNLVRLCVAASDYFIHTGERYLTSATARVAMSYAKPMIAEEFGATTDMCKGALVPLRPNVDLLEVIEGLPMPTSAEYAHLAAQAARRDSERSWTGAARNLAAAISSLDVGRSGCSPIRRVCND